MSQPDPESSREYCVVFQNTSGSVSDGVITWSSFGSKADFDAWYTAKMRSWYKVVAEGVTADQAVDLCSTPAADLAVRVALVREVASCLSQAVALATP